VIPEITNNHAPIIFKIKEGKNLMAPDIIYGNKSEYVSVYKFSFADSFHSTF